MSELFFSVIVPVYQVEQYLPECIESLQKQIFDDFEVVMVDDGSTDASGNICDLTAAADDRFHVIHQANSGLSGARNTGIKAAKGKYLIFLDSDDMLQNNALMTIASDLKSCNADVWCGGCSFYPTEQYSVIRSALNCNKTVIMKGQEALLKMLEEGSFYAPAWLNVCKRETLLGKNLFFKNNIFHEDEEWTPRMLMAIDSICCSPVSFYLYRQRTSSSITSTNSLKRLHDCCCYGLDLAEILCAGKIPKPLQRVLRQRATNFWILPMTAAGEYMPSERIETFKNCCRKYPLKAMSYLISSNRRWKFLFFIVPLLRTTIGCKIFCSYIQSRLKGVR